MPGGRSPFEYTKAEEHGIPQTAKVNIPNASTLRAPIPRVNDDKQSAGGSNVDNTFESRELSAVHVPR